MAPTAYLALFGWPVISLILAMSMPIRRAVAISIIIGWLFLPVAGVPFPILPQWDKMVAVGGAAFGTAFICDSGRMLKFRPTIYDLPIMVWIIAPFISSITNELGLYDGIVAGLTHLVNYGMPYLIGRVYFNDPRGWRFLAIAFILGAVIYIPFCLAEIRLSPQMHKWVYGFAQIPSHMTKRLGGYRPVVFLTHGIELGLWMANASMCALWLWRTKAVRKWWGVPFSLIAIALLGTTVLCKSLNSLILLTGALGALMWIKWFRFRYILIVVAAIPVSYVTLRLATEWQPENVVEFVEKIDEDRADSLGGRIFEEERFLAHAWRQPVFGWGGWDRHRPMDEQAEKGDGAINDSWWIIAFGKFGLFGLISLGATLLMPAICWSFRYQPLKLSDPLLAAGTGLCLASLTFAIDCLANAMVNPLYFVILGGLAAPAKLPYVSRVMTSKRTRKRNPYATPHLAQPATARTTSSDYATLPREG